MESTPLDLVAFHAAVPEDLRTLPFAQKHVLFGELRMAGYAAFAGAPGSAIRGAESERWDDLLAPVLLWPLSGDSATPWPIRQARDDNGPQLVISEEATGFLIAAPWDQGEWGVPHERAVGRRLTDSDWWWRVQANPDAAYWSSLANGLVRIVQIAGLVQQKRPESPQAAFDLLQIGIVEENLARLQTAFPSMRYFRSPADNAFGLLLEASDGSRLWLFSDDRSFGSGYGVAVRGLESSDESRIEEELAGMEFWADLADLKLQLVSLGHLMSGSARTSPQASPAP